LKPKDVYRNDSIVAISVTNIKHHGDAMTKRPTQLDLLTGIKENIQLTEKQIFHLKRDLDALAKEGATVEQRTLLRKLSTLEDNLQLLKKRWMHAVNPQSCLEQPLAIPDGPQEENEQQ
jgi:hypothetical protein